MINTDALIHDLVLTLTRELAQEGARAVLLFGSAARGDLTPYSDIDLVALGTGVARSEMRSGRLIVVSWTTPDAVQASFTDPAKICVTIPSWRDAHILHDPDRFAAELQYAAHDWTWYTVDPAVCDAYIAREITGLAEEVLKLVSAMRTERHLMAAVQRNVLVLQLAGIMALHRHMLYRTENQLWDMLAETMGAAWAVTQARAFGLDGEPFEITCRAALHLYAQAANAARVVFDPGQRPVVVHACAATGFPLD